MPDTVQDMPSLEARVVVPVTPDVAFAVSQTTGETRLRWDPFIRRQHFLDRAERPAVGVRTRTVHRFGLAMTSEYVSFNPPTNVGMRMVDGSWFFEKFAGGWQFRPAEDRPGHTVATWPYTFATRPEWLAPLADRIGVRLLGRDIRRRLDAFARGCTDPVVLAAVEAP